MCDWGKCDTAIGELENLLSCDICHHLVDNPCMLGGCEHCFCRSCISDQLGENCPVCDIPSHARDVQSNRQLANVVLMCKRFKRLLAQNTATQHEGGGELNSPKETKKKNKSHDLEESSHQPASVQKENLVPPVNKDPYAVYDFESSRMTTTSKPAGRRTRSVTAKNVKKKALAAVNKRWGIKQSPSEASFNDPCTSCKKTKEGREERKRRVQIITPTSSIKSKGHVSNINDTSIQGVNNCYNAAIDIAGGFVTGDDDKNKDAVDKCNVSNSAISSEKTATAATKANVLNEEISTDNDASVTIQTENDDHINHIQSGKYPGKSGEDKNRSHGGCGADSKHHKPECDEQDSEQGAVTVEELGLCATPTSAVHRSRRPRTLHHSENHRPKSGDRVHNRNLPTGTVLSPSPVTIRKTRRSAETNLSPAPTRKSRRSSETPPASVDSPGHTKTTRQSVEKQNIPAAQVRQVTRRSLSPPSAKSKQQPTKRSSLQASDFKSTPRQTTNRKSLSPFGVKVTPRQTSSRRSFSPSGVKLRGSPSALCGESSVASPACKKRNAKGETPLHLAAIKGDSVLVDSLLSEGADPNTKDNAGWTPLHEACNHGYTEIAEKLLKAGAYIDMPGLDNDTPLHDAVQNNRIKVVKLLVSYGASLNTRNVHGLTPRDCITTEAVRKALETSKPEKTVPSSPQVMAQVPRYNRLVLLPTGLTRDQKRQLEKCAKLLNAGLATDFSLEVTHVVTTVNAEGMCPRTMKYLQAVLTGKWVVNFEWVSLCLEYKHHVCEEAFEVPGSSTNPDSQAPRLSRLNAERQLPGLFNGCHFFFHGTFTYPSPSKDDLVQLVKYGGGVVLAREPKLDTLDNLDNTVPYHAKPDTGLANCGHYIVQDKEAEDAGKSSKWRSSRLRKVSAAWVMDCAARFCLLDNEG